MGLDFCTGSARDYQKMCQLLVSASAEAFCDVGHYTHRSTLQLVAQAEILSEPPDTREPVRRIGQNSGFLPGFDFFEFMD